jgi:hypothetical protein
MVREGGDFDDSANSVAVDPDGSAVYATGSSRSKKFGGRVNRGATDLVLMKLSPEGRRAWVRSSGGPALDAGEGVAVDAEHSVWITGETGRAAANQDGAQVPALGDLLVQRYSPGGKLRWQRKERREGFNRGADIAVVESDRAIVTGDAGYYPFQPGNPQIVMVKYQSDGVVHLRRQFGGEASDWAGGVAVDGLSAYVVGTADEPFDGAAGHGQADIAVIQTPNGPLPTRVRTHLTGTRTGVARVDSVLDGIQARDAGGLAGMIAYEMVPCDNHPEPGIIDPPRCPKGVPDGTPVEVVKMACETWRYVRPDAVAAYFRAVFRDLRGLFGVEFVQAADGLNILRPRGHGIVLAVEEDLKFPRYEYGGVPDAPDADGVVIGIDESGITGIIFGCGDPPAIWKAAEWILPPAGLPE